MEQNQTLGPVIATRHLLFATSSGQLDLTKIDAAIKAFAVDPPAATASTLGGLTNLSDAAKAAMDGNVSGVATSGAMAFGNGYACCYCEWCG